MSTDSDKSSSSSSGSDADSDYDASGDALDDDATPLKKRGTKPAALVGGAAVKGERRTASPVAAKGCSSRSRGNSKSRTTTAAAGDDDGDDDSSSDDDVEEGSEAVYGGGSMRRRGELAGELAALRGMRGASETPSKGWWCLAWRGGGDSVGWPLQYVCNAPPRAPPNQSNQPTTPTPQLMLTPRPSCCVCAPCCCAWPLRWSCPPTHWMISLTGWAGSLRWQS